MTAFWMMVNILPHQDLVATIRAEIAPTMVDIISRGASITQFELSEILRTKMMQSCPVLNSMFNEVIRFYSTGSSVREAVRPVRIDGKVVPKGTKFLLPQRQLLVAPEAFGEDADRINPYRFIQRKDLDRHEYYRPFGGGITLCSGKTVGRYEVLSFVAWALWRYDCEVVPNGGQAVDGTKGMGIPRIDLKKPSLGVSKQVEGDDMVVMLRRRKA